MYRRVVVCMYAGVSEWVNQQILVDVPSATGSKICIFQNGFAVTFFALKSKFIGVYSKTIDCTNCFFAFGYFWGPEVPSRHARNIEYFAFSIS